MPQALAFCGVSITVLVTGFGFLLQHKERKLALRQAGIRETMARAEPLVAAIRAYEKREGKPPESLTALRLTVPPAGAMAEQRLDTVQGWDYRTTSHASEHWALLVWVRRDHTPNMGFGDCFAYHSDGSYPKHAYGGVLERVGAWGYYWE